MKRQGLSICKVLPGPAVGRSAWVGLALGLLVVHQRRSAELFRFGSRLCKKSKTLDCDRISYSFKAAVGAHIASQFIFGLEPENIVLVAL